MDAPSKAAWQHRPLLGRGRAGSISAKESTASSFQMPVKGMLLLYALVRKCSVLHKLRGPDRVVSFARIGQRCQEQRSRWPIGIRCPIAPSPLLQTHGLGRQGTDSALCQRQDSLSRRQSSSGLAPTTAPSQRFRPWRPIAAGNSPSAERSETTLTDEANGSRFLTRTFRSTAIHRTCRAFPQLPIHRPR